MMPLALMSSTPCSSLLRRRACQAGNAVAPIYRVSAGRARPFKPLRARADTNGNEGKEYRSRAATPEVFQQVESMIVQNFNSEQPGGRLDWEEIAGCWVLRPPPSAGPPEAIVRFVGGAFLGAAPELTYRLFLETLAARNVLVVAAPYETGFKQTDVIQGIHGKFFHCMKVLKNEVSGLPIYGVGHSLGAVLILDMCARFSGVDHTGNVLISFNNRPATDVIPFLSPFIAPGARAMENTLRELAVSPMRSRVEVAAEDLKGLSPSLFKMLAPLVEQLAPVFFEVSKGKTEFEPTPEATETYIRERYSVKRNLLIKFMNDDIDQTGRLSKLLTEEASKRTDVRMQTMAGDHLRPCMQNVVDLPPDVARLANEAIRGSGSLIGSLSGVANQMGLNQMEGPLKTIGRQVSEMSTFVGGVNGGPITDSSHELAKTLTDWMGIGQKALPPPLPQQLQPAGPRR